MAQRAAGKDQLIKCEFCGEEYSATYRRCPFCNGDGTGRWDAVDEDAGLSPEEYEDEDEGRGGRRLLGAGGGGGYNGPSIASVLGAILSLALIAAAVCIVITIIKPLLGGRAPTPAESAQPQVSQSAPPESQTPVSSPEAEPTASEGVEPSAPAVSAPVASAPVASAPVSTTVPVTTAAPNASGVTGFSLSKEDFTLFTKGESYRVKVAFQPQGAAGSVAWRSENENIATVDADGRVTAVGKGTVNIVASVEGVGEKKCIVRCNLKDAAQTPAETKKPDQSDAPATGLSLNRTDFTLMSKGETFRMKVSGTDSAVTWKSSDPDVATIDSKGLVTAVSKGSCTITATVDGKTLECIARCRF